MTTSSRTHTTERHIAAYFRVSSAGQTIESQRAGVYAKAAELYPGIEVVEYRDEGVSAFHNALDERPGSSSLQAAIEAGEVLAVVIDSQDRLSRGGSLEIQLFLDACARHGTAVHTLTGGELRLTDEESVFVSGLVAHAASYTARKEAREKQHRSKRGRTAAAERGVWPGGSPPPGYDRGKDGRLVPSDDIAPLLTEMFELYMHGLGVMKLARRMKRKTGDDRWIYQRVGDCLDNPVYIGTIRNGGIEYPNSHPPLVDLDTWHQVQEMRDEAKASNRRQTRVQPFSSTILRCGDCGGPLKPKPDKRHHGYLDYFCPDCKTRYAAEYLNLPIAALLSFAHLLLTERLHDPTEGLRQDQEVELAKAELDELRRRMANLVVHIEDAPPDDPAALRYRELQAQARDAEKQLRRLQSSDSERRVELEQLRETLDAFAVEPPPGADPEAHVPFLAGWLQASVEQQHALIVATMQRIEVFDHGQMRVKFRHLARPLSSNVERRSRHRGMSKALRVAGFGSKATSPS